jgi:hypothetical protein
MLAPMVCVSWWVATVALLGAVLAGLLGFYVWTWWLLSAPGSQSRD